MPIMCQGNDLHIDVGCMTKDRYVMCGGNDTSLTWAKQTSAEVMQLDGEMESDSMGCFGYVNEWVEPIAFAKVEKEEEQDLDARAGKLVHGIFSNVEGEQWDSWLQMEVPTTELRQKEKCLVINDVKITKTLKARKHRGDPWNGGVAFDPQNPGDCLFDAFGYFLENNLEAKELRQHCIRVWRQEDMKGALQRTAAKEGMTPQRYCTRMGRKMWGGKAELAILCHLAKCRAAVYNPWGLRYAVGDTGPWLHLGFFASHYVALRADPEVVRQVRVRQGESMGPSRGAGDLGRSRRRRSRSRRSRTPRRARVTLTPAPDRGEALRRRQDNVGVATAAPCSEDVPIGEKKFIIKPIAGLSFEDERSWLEMVTWQQGGVRGCDWRCLLCQKWATTAHRESSQH